MGRPECGCVVCESGMDRGACLYPDAVSRNAELERELFAARHIIIMLVHEAAWITPSIAAAEEFLSNTPKKKLVLKQE